MPEIELAAAVVVLKGRVLVVRRSSTEGFLPGRWGVPCGKINKDEDACAAVLRELHEETGLRGEVVGQAGQSEFPSIWCGLQVNNIQHNYLIRAKMDPARVDFNGMPEVHLPKTDQVAKWVPVADIWDFGLDQHNLQTIRQGLEALVGATGEAPDGLIDKGARRIGEMPRTAGRDDDRQLWER